MAMHSCWRRAAVGVLVCACAMSAPKAWAQSANAVSSLSGHVYLDANGNHELDLGADWAIRGASVTLSKEGDSSFIVSVKTDKCGFYSFDGLSASDHSGLPSGIYDISLAPYTGADSGNSSGAFQSLETGMLVAPTDLSDLGSISADRNSFSGIKVMPGTAGVDYDFGKAQYPLELVSKQMLLTTSDLPQRSATPTPVAPPLETPEPATFGLLALGSLCLIATTLARRARRR
jgi:hypothetical protein